MRTIQTKFIGATNHRPARIKAWSEKTSVTISYCYEARPEEAHDNAMRSLCLKLGNKNWLGQEFVRGHTDNGYVYVFADDTRVTS